MGRSDTLAAQVLRFGQLAAKHLNTIPKNPAEFIQTMAEIGRAFGPEHLRILRKREPVPIELGEKIIGHILWTTAFLLPRSSRQTPRFPEGSIVAKHLPFSVCTQLISHGVTVDI